MKGHSAYFKMVEVLGNNGLCLQLYYMYTDIVVSLNDLHMKLLVIICYSQKTLFYKHIVMLHVFPAHKLLYVIQFNFFI